VPVGALERLVLVEHADQDRRRRPDQRDDRPVELVPDDDGIGDAQDRGRHDHRVEAEKDMRHEALTGHVDPPWAGRLRQAPWGVKARMRRTRAGATTMGAQPVESPQSHDGRRPPVSQTRFINPDTLSKPPGYTHVVEATTPGRIVYIAGQLGIDREGKLSSDFRLQAVQTFENLKNALAAVGGQFQHVVKLNNYFVDM